MRLRIVLRDEAQAEFDEAFDWYDARKPGLGLEFVEIVQQCFDRISSQPLMCAVVFADIRKAVLRRRPYCVLCRPHADRVEVIAVFHTSRDPSVWHGRA